MIGRSLQEFYGPTRGWKLSLRDCYKDDFEYKIQKYYLSTRNNSGRGPNDKLEELKLNVPFKRDVVVKLGKNENYS